MTEQSGACGNMSRPRDIRRWLSGTPDVQRAGADYARLAPAYDSETHWIDAVREAAVARLALQPGEIVADIACGTGFCLSALSRAVGSRGKVIGIEASPDMIALARSRIATLANVELIESPAHAVRLAAAPDALLFSFAHDVLQSRAALENVLTQAKVGARVVAVGSKLFPWWLGPRNLWFLADERGYVTTYRGFSRPWRLLAGLIDDFTVRAIPPGNKYIVTGRIRPPPFDAAATEELRMRGPDAPRSIESYRHLAKDYDASSLSVMPIREEAVALLGLQSGHVAIDIASGTGLSFPLLMNRIGPAGHLIAIEHSPEMMALARQRVESAGWRNVTLIESTVEAADIPLLADAVLFQCTHDVLQSPAALANVFARAKPGAWVAVVGAKFTSWWLAPLNLWVMIRARRYLTTYSGLQQPWRHLLLYVPELMVRSYLHATGYIAWGRFRPPRAGHGTPVSDEPEERAPIGSSSATGATPPRQTEPEGR